MKERVFVIQNLLVCLNAVLPIFLLLAVGYLAKCLGYLNRDDVQKVNRLLFKFFMPVLMFYNIYNSDLSSAFRPRLIAYAVLGVLTAFALGVLWARAFVPDRRQKAVMIQGVYRSNFVLIGLPIASSLMGEADMGPVALLLAIVVPLFNVLAVIVLEYFNGEKPKPGKLLLDILKNPLILGTLTAMLVLLLHIPLPAPVLKVAGQMATTVGAMLLVMLGAFLRFDGMKNQRRQLAVIVAARLVAVPGIFLSLAALLGFRGVELAGLIGVFASPVGTTTFPMSLQMGGDAELAGNAVVATSALCSFTLFLWCLLFKSLNLL